MNSEPPVTAVESAANEAPLAQSEIPPSTPHTENSQPENQRKGQKQVRVSDFTAAPESSSVSPVNPTEQGDFPSDVEISPTSAGGAGMVAAAISTGTVVAGLVFPAGSVAVTLMF